MGEIFNGSGYISGTGSLGLGDKVVVLGNDFYMGAQELGSMTIYTTTTNVSLVLDPNAPTGTNPYGADVAVTDNNGNMAMGNLWVTVKDPSNGGTIASGYAVNGTAQITLPDYYPSVSATVEDYDNDFYYGSSGSATVQYNLPDMIQTQGLTGSKLQLTKSYLIT